jgi:hypothetical protein
MGNGNEETSAIESLLIDALSITLTRRLAERILGDVRRNRAGKPMPRDVDGLLALVKDDLAHATFLRVGARATSVLAEVETRVIALSALPVEAWKGPRVRFVYVGRSAEAATYLADQLGAQPVLHVIELHELFMALDTDEQTLVVVDSADTALCPLLLSRLVPDFPSHVLTFVASSSPATREAYLSSGAAFRATLRSEPMDHPDVPQMLQEIVSGVGAGAARSRSRGGVSTTTEPRRAA